MLLSSLVQISKKTNKNMKREKSEEEIEKERNRKRKTNGTRQVYNLLSPVEQIIWFFPRVKKLPKK